MCNNHDRQYANITSLNMCVLLFIQSCSYDHIELNFFLNGQSLHCPVTGIKGTVYPVLYGELLKMYVRIIYEVVVNCV